MFPSFSLQFLIPAALTSWSLWLLGEKPTFFVCRPLGSWWFQDLCSKKLCIAAQMINIQFKSVTNLFTRGRNCGNSTIVPAGMRKDTNDNLNVINSIEPQGPLLYHCSGICPYDSGYITSQLKRQPQKTKRSDITDENNAAINSMIDAQYWGCVTHFLRSKKRSVSFYIHTWDKVVAFPWVWIF